MARPEAKILCVDLLMAAAGGERFTAVTRHFPVALDSSAVLILTFQASVAAAAVAAIEVTPSAKLCEGLLQSHTHFYVFTNACHGACGNHNVWSAVHCTTTCPSARGVWVDICKLLHRCTQHRPAQ